MKYSTKLLRNFRKISSIFFLQLNIKDTTQLITSTFRAKSLKNRIEYSRYWQNSTTNKKKIIVYRSTIKIQNYYLWLLFVARKNFLKFDKLLAGLITKVHP